MKNVRTIGLLILLAISGWGADVSGKWKGEMILDNGDRAPAYVRLKQEGAVIKGTQGPSDDKQFPITNGRVEGEEFIIEARPGSAVLRLTMKLDGNKLAGDVFEDDSKIGTISLQKVEE